MARCVHESDTMLWIFEEGLTASHRLEDTPLALLTKVVRDSAAIGHQTHEGLGLMRVELVEHKDPDALRVGVDSSCDVGGEILLVSRGPNAGSNGLSRHHIEVGDQTERPVPLVFELNAFSQARPYRFRGMDSLNCLDSRLLVSADHMPPFGRQPRRIRVGLADIAHIGFVLLWVPQLVLGG